MITSLEGVFLTFGSLESLKTWASNISLIKNDTLNVAWCTTTPSPAYDIVPNIKTLNSYDYYIVAEMIKPQPCISRI